MTNNSECFRAPRVKNGRRAHICFGEVDEIAGVQECEDGQLRIAIVGGSRSSAKRLATVETGTVDGAEFRVMSARNSDIAFSRNQNIVVLLVEPAAGR